MVRLRRAPSLRSGFFSEQKENPEKPEKTRKSKGERS